MPGHFLEEEMDASKAYVLFNSLTGLMIGVTATAYGPYLVSVGVTLPQIAAINVVFLLTIVISELPTGMVADGRSRLWSLRIGAAVFAASALAYAAISGFWGALACEIGLGIGCSFLSGANQAWLVDAMHKEGEGHRVREALAASSMWHSICMVAGGTAGAFLGAYGLRVTMLSSGLCALLAFVATVTVMGNVGEPDRRVSEIEAMRRSVRALRCGSGLVWAIVAVTAFGLVIPFNHYWSLFFRERVGQDGLAFAWTVIYGGCAFGGYVVRRWGVRIVSDSTAVVISLAVVGIGLAMVGSCAGAFLPLMFAFAHEAARGAFNPLSDAFVQRRIESCYRATFGSLQSFISRIGHSLILFAVWLCTRAHAADPDLIVTVWLFSGLLLAAVAAALWFFRPDGQSAIHETEK